MKKTILSFFAMGLMAVALVSCGGENKSVETTTTTTTETTAPPAEATTTTTSTTTSSAAPVFSSEEVNKGIADYKALIGEYTAALQTKDAAKIQELTGKYQTWSQSAATWATKLKPEEAQQFSEYMQQLSAEWTAISQNAGQ